MNTSLAYKTPPKRLKYLAIGNSFSDDTVRFLFPILRDMGVEEIVLGNLYYPGCPLHRQLRNLREDHREYDYRLNTDGEWHTTPQSSIRDAILSEDWDVISMQQVSGLSGLAVRYDCLPELIDEVRALCGDKPRFIWNMTWTYKKGTDHPHFPFYDNDQEKMYRAILDVTFERILPNPAFEALVPTGTAIANARTSFLGDNLNRDGFHLNMTTGRYITGLCMAHALTGVSLDCVRFAPEGIVNSIYAKELRAVCMEAAQNAIDTPFAVTPSRITEVAPLHLEDYEEVPFVLTEGVHYEPFSDGKALITVADGSAAVTSLLSREELPAGSILALDCTWQLRADGVKTDGTPLLPRPAFTATELFRVSNAWWGEAEGRAITLMQRNLLPLTEAKTPLDQALKIYRPKK